MKATITKADNGYVVTLRFSSALAEQTHIFKDLKGAFEKIDGFFLEGLLAEAPDPEEGTIGIDLNELAERVDELNEED